MKIENFVIEMLGIEMKMDIIWMEYDSLKVFNYFVDNVCFFFCILLFYVILNDILVFVLVLFNFKEKLDFNIDVEGMFN